MLIEARKLSMVTEILLQADERIRVQEPLQICLESSSKAKTVTNNLPILSVLALVFLLNRLDMLS
jgi:hypothetical protein